jgi:hypothetical protein
MSGNIQDDLKHIKAALLDGMRDYMNDLNAEADDPGYTELEPVINFKRVPPQRSLTSE